MEKKFVDLLVDKNHNKSIKNQAVVLILISVVYFLIGILEFGLDRLIAFITIGMGVIYIIIGIILIKMSKII